MVEFTLDELYVLTAALDGFEPDTASYDPTDESPMGWSPDETATLNRIYDRLVDAAIKLGKELAS